MSTTRKWGLVVHHWSPQVISCVCTHTTDICHSVEVCLVQVWVWRKWQSGMNNLQSILSILHPYVGDERENLQVWSTRVKVTQSPVVCSVRLPAQGKRARNLVWEFSLKVEPQNPTQIKSRCLCTGIYFWWTFNRWNSCSWNFSLWLFKPSTAKRQTDHVILWVLLDEEYQELDHVYYTWLIKWVVIRKDPVGSSLCFEMMWCG